MFDFGKPICPTCLRELDGVYTPDGTPWHCKVCAKDQTDPIHCEAGCKVKFAFPEFGMVHERDAIKKSLEVGAVYTVEEVYVDMFRTEIKLEERPGVKFNSVFFQRVS